ncbi:unnamed protein product [Phytophthora fragariaefolia]|uniref:Unnamed protein product n=1 Tax=Phytophthora fragariaefolia TaxID=1490495 RepID=A0A9W6TTW4_9STRA|nr:unnamed protein product [Phytophthora fragariaefolia]
MVEPAFDSCAHRHAERMEVLALLPSEFWGSSISMTKEWFTIENVEISLRRVFGDRSKKEITMVTDKRRPVAINVVKKTSGRKRNQDDSSVQGSDECFYCFHTGHRKADCPVKVKDRDPNRQGGPLFRTDIRKLPGVGKKKRLMTVKNTKKAVPAAGATNSRNGKSPIDGLLFDKDLEEEL